MLFITCKQWNIVTLIKLWNTPYVIFSVVLIKVFNDICFFMIQKFREIQVETSRQKLIDISKQIEFFIKDTKVVNGILNLSILKKN